MKITVIGAGLAGCEAAYALAECGIEVLLIEMKPLRFSPAHSNPNFAELVCSNSLRSSILESGPGLLKEELKILGSLTMMAVEQTAVPAGKATAVDRDLFAEFITRILRTHPRITTQSKEITKLPLDSDDPVIIATGPLTSDELAADIREKLGGDSLSFYDAIAPIVSADSLDMSKLFFASRYDCGGEEGDYLNSAMDENEYRDFVNAILNAEKVDPYPFEKIPHFEGCLPIEELARRGPETLAFGPMKPVGLENPITGERPYAVIQLRAENREKTMYNLVGFQTKMTYSEQERVFRTIPGLEHATFLRLGSIHRNTFLNAPLLLDEYSRSRKYMNIYFAGQITGVEGYIESAASGLAVGLLAAHLVRGESPELPPPTTAIGALLKHTRDVPHKKYEPMNINFGLLEPLVGRVPRKKRKEEYAKRAIRDITAWQAKWLTGSKRSV